MSGKKISLLLPILMLLFGSVRARETVYSVSTLEAIPAGMASAVTARPGGLEAVLYNPAAFSRYGAHFRPQSLELTLYLNPAGWAGYGRAYSETGRIPDTGLFGPGMFLLRGLAVTYSQVSIGVILAEEELDNTRVSSDKWFNLGDLPVRHRSIGFARLALAERVSIGVALTAYVRNQSIESIGAMYGVYLTPGSRFRVGVSFVELPVGQNESRRPIAGLEDQTVNAGICFLPDLRTKMTVDFRSVFHENDQRSLETRFGLEREFGDHIALRAGYLPHTQDGEYYLTYGISLLGIHALEGKRYQYSVPSHIISYALVQEVNGSLRSYTHLLTVTLEIG